MIVKAIRASVKPGLSDEFIRRQRVWNDAMSRQEGFLFVHVAIDAARPDDVWLWIAMQTREALDRFMRTDHDLVMAETRMTETYEQLEVRILDVVEPGPPQIALDVAPSRSDDAYQLVLLSEAYRFSAVVRTALLAGIFDALDEGGIPIADLAVRRGVRVDYLHRLVDALAALQLVTVHDGRVAPAPIARRHLTRGHEAYLGDLLLHNTRPSHWQRWGTLDELLGMTPIEEQPNDQTLFALAMSGTAAAGQAAALLRAVDLKGRSRLLDVGGASGDYAIALCHAYPGLTAVVLDLTGLDSMARARISAAGLDHRVGFQAGDYRRALPDGQSFDAVLLSNVCRGETLEEAERLIARARAALAAGGVLYIQDLFVNEPEGRGPLLAACFGLHVPDAMNGSTAQVMAMLRCAGFGSVTDLPLDNYVVANRVITALRE